MKRITVFLSAVLAAALLGGIARADTSDFSGYEIFAGIKVFGTTVGATFTGWTNNPQTLPVNACSPTEFGAWVPFVDNTRGLVSGSINYVGTAGFGNKVNVIGGKWSWTETDGTKLAGNVLSGGIVTWPTDSGTNIGCGCGVAVFNIPVAVGQSHNPSGSFAGCLDDQLSFPPKIWGVVNVVVH
jgi:hypothetical protein